jgi:hypothetical protein
VQNDSVSKNEVGRWPNETVAKKNMKQKAIHEGWELLVLFVYLGFFFCAIVTYRMLLLKGYESVSLDYGFAHRSSSVREQVTIVVNLTASQPLREL